MVSDLGIIAMRHPDIKLEWNSDKMMFNNCTAANAMITPPYRIGWKLWAILYIVELEGPSNNMKGAEETGPGQTC